MKKLERIEITEEVLQELSNELKTIDNKNKKEKLETVKILSEELNSIKVKKLQKNFLDVISRNRYDENLISNWLSFLLNPEINGVGNKPLYAMLNALKLDNNIDIQKFKTIDREKTTDTNKRMDLLIKYSNTWIIIENKINSAENGIQTKDYYEYIMKQYEVISGKVEPIFIYLKPNYNKSIPSEKSFKEITYGDFIIQLRKIKETDFEEPSKYRYLDEFIRVGECYMKQEEFEINDEIKFYVKNYEKLLQIEKDYTETNQLFVNKLINDLKKHFWKNYYKVEVRKKSKWQKT